MKKSAIILLLCAAVAACTSDKKAENNEDSAANAHMYAEDRQSEFDSAQQKTGTEPAAGETGTTAGAKGEQLISQSDCLTCHKVDEKLIGPSYVEVAQKYENTDKNVEYLADKIIKGGSGVWGQIPMTPHPALSADDAKEMARYVLSLRK